MVYDGYGRNLESVNSESMLQNKFMSTSCEIALKWIAQSMFVDKSTLVQVMVCCLMATNHYLSQCWLKSVLPYGVIRLHNKWLVLLRTFANGYSWRKNMVFWFILHRIWLAKENYGLYGVCYSLILLWYYFIGVSNKILNLNMRSVLSVHVYFK